MNYSQEDRTNYGADIMPGVKNYFVQKGIMLSTMDLQDAMPISVGIPSMDECIEFTFVLAGESTATHYAGQRECAILTEPNSAVIFHASHSNWLFSVPNQKNLRIVNVLADIHEIKDIWGFSPEFPLVERLKINQPTKLTVEQRLIAYQVLTCTKKGLAKDIFLHAKTLELLASCLEQTEAMESEATAKTYFSQKDVEIIHQAHTILHTRLIDPPSLDELAQTLCISKSKLKKGFHHVFGKTPYACLHEQRMQHAYEFITAGTHNVSEAAWAVGYSNVGHFGVAFQKHFGVKPKSLQIELCI